jgi:hypothetical protein
MRRSVDIAAALALALGAFAAYVATLTPGLAYQGGDGNELTVVMATLGLAHPTGYPLYTWIGWLFTHGVPFGSVAYRANLMSATLGAAGVGMIYLVARRLPVHPVPAALATAAFAVSSTFWSQAVIAEVYAPNVLAVAGTLWLALRWADGVAYDPSPRRDDRRFAVFALAYGASFGMHLSNLGFAPAYAAFALLVDPGILRRPASVLRAVFAFLVGIAQFAWLPYRAGASDLFPNSAPTDWRSLYSYTLGAFTRQRFAFGGEEVPAHVAQYLGLVIDNFGAIGLLLAFAGMVRLAWRAPRRFWLLVPMWAVHVGAFMRAFLLDPNVFFVASNVLVALFVAEGIDGARAAIARGGARLGAPRATGVVSTVAVVVAIALLVRGGRTSWRENDRSTDTVVDDFYDVAFAMLPTQSMLVPPGRGAFGAAAAYWRLTHDARPDVVIAGRGVPPPVDRPATFCVGTTAPAALRLLFVPRDAEPMPILRGGRVDLVLYRMERGRQGDPWPPPREAPTSATLLGAEVTVVQSVRPGRVRVRGTWRFGEGSRPIVSTRIGAVTVEAHRLSGQAVTTPNQHVLEETYEVLVPSEVPTGSQPIALGAVDFENERIAVRWTPVGQVAVE